MSATDPTPDSGVANPRSAPLDYASPESDAGAARGWVVAVQAVGVGLIGLFLMFVIAMGTFLAVARTPVGWALIPAVIFLWLRGAAAAWRSPRYRGVAIGLWAGPGIVAALVLAWLLLSR